MRARLMVLIALLTALCIRHSCSHAGAKPSLEIRGVTMEFPFWLGTSMYDNHWRGYAENERHTNWWWFNREHWQRKFAEMERLHLNALALLHPHPYPALVNLPAFPNAHYFDDATLARNRKMFRWILSEGKRHGVSIYFLTWNIVLPPKFATAHGLAEFGADVPLARAYTRAIVAELFRTYPDLGGLITMAGETPPRCIDFVEDAICGGLRDSGVNPQLIFKTWCSYPEDAMRIIKAYPRTYLLHPLQYEQLFVPKADPRIGRFSRECGNIPMIALGGPKSAHGYLFWGDPQWAREIVLDLRRQNGIGLFLETYCADPWLARESFARYMHDVGTHYDPTEWARKIGKRYARADLGAELLMAMQHASRIIPRLLMLVHSQSDHFKPQFGLPLIYYLEMPTVSTYVFENVQTVDERGYLRPNLGLCYPNPDWGERVASVWEFVAGKAPHNATTPLQIADQIERHATQCLKIVYQIRNALTEHDGAYLRQLLDRLELNAHLGLHFASKIRSAVAWARFKRSKGTGEACVRHLVASVKAWERVATIASKLYPKSVTFWRSEMASQPPWTQNQLWHSYRLVRSHWREHLEPFRREVEIIRREIARGRERASLPLWENLFAEPRERLELIFADDFERRDDVHWIWSEGSAWTDNPAEVISGKGAVRLDTRALKGKYHNPLRWRPNAVRLKVGERYQLEFDYRILMRGLDFPDSCFAVAARTPTGGVKNDIGTGRFWSGRNGTVGHRVVFLTPRHYDDYALFFSIHGRAAIVIDNLRVYRIKEKHRSSQNATQPSK